MNGSRRRFSVTVPDWGQDHLSSDAIVAYVDNELADGPQTRATRHLTECRECSAQVFAQGQARAALRSAACPSLPSSLLSSLRSIPQDTELPGPPPGLAMTADGQLVSVLRTDRGAGLPIDTPPAGMPSAALVPTAARRAPAQRRIRFGAGAAVSGLALGALAFAAPAVENGPMPAAAVDHGVLGSVPAQPASQVVPAQRQITPVSEYEPLMDRLNRVPGSFLGPH